MFERVILFSSSSPSQGSFGWVENKEKSKEEGKGEKREKREENDIWLKKMGEENLVGPKDFPPRPTCILFSSQFGRKTQWWKTC